MKLVIVALGSAGDVHPFLAIGQAALRRGHRVVVHTSPAFRARVEACGLAFRPVGTESEFHRAMADPALWAPRTALRTLWALVARSLAPVHAQVRAEADRDTVVIGSLWAFGARALHDSHGVPYLSAQVSPSTLFSAHRVPEHGRLAVPEAWPLPLKRCVVRAAEAALVDRVMAPQLNAFLRRLGLPPARRVLSRWVHSPQGVLALFPEWFAPRQPDWPQALHFTGFPRFTPPGADLDDGLRRFLDNGPPPVVVTMGSTLTDAAPGGPVARALAAVRALGQRAVVLGGPDLAAADAPDVLHRRFVPLDGLLPRSAGIVHHGGVGTVAAALAAGAPQWVLPSAHDQFDNARRVVDLGAGGRLRPDAPVPALAQALRRGLADAALHARCAALRERLQAEPPQHGAERAVDLAQACLARHRRPGWSITTNAAVTNAAVTNVAVTNAAAGTATAAATATAAVTAAATTTTTEARARA